MTKDYKYILRVLKSLKIPFSDDCDPTYVGECCAVGAGDDITNFTLIGSDLTITTVDGDVFTVTLPGPVQALTSVINTVVGNKIGDYVDENGASTPFFETVTSIQYSNGILTYTDEAGANTSLAIPTIDSGIFDGTNITITNNDGSTVIIPMSLPQSVVTKIITGQTIATHNDGLGNIVQIDESITTLNEISTGVFEYTNELGNVTTVTIASETVTTFVDNNNGSVTYTNEDGTPTTIQIGETTTNIVITPTGFNYTNEDGNLVTYTAPVETVTTFTDNGNGTYTYTSEDGTLTTTAVPGAETVTTLTLNANGFTYTSESGTITTYVQPIEVVTTLVDTGTQFTYTNEVGSSVVVTYGETLTSLSLTGSVLTYTDENTNPINITLPGGSLSVITNLLGGNRVATHNDGNGTVLDINESITGMVLAGNALVYTKEGGTTDTIDLSPFLGTNLPRIVSGSIIGTDLTLVRDDATTIVIDLSSLINKSVISNTVIGHLIGSHDDGTGNIVQINETITGLSKAGSILTYVKEDGATDVITLDTGNTSIFDQTIVGNTIGRHNDGTGLLTTINESITGLVLVGTTLTYTQEGGTDQIISLSSLGDTSVVSNTIVGHLIGTHNDGTGNLVNINETITSIGFAGQVLSYVDENGTTTTMDLSGLNLNSTLSNLIGGNRIATHINGVGVISDIDETITTLTNTGGSNFRYTSENGTITNFSIAGNETITTLVNIGTQVSYTSENGTITTFDYGETLTTLSLVGSILNYVDENGVTTPLTIPTGTTSIVDQVIAGNAIARHNDGNGNLVTINENITTLTNVGNIFTYVSENGTSTAVDYGETLTTLNLSGSDLTYLDENGISTVLSIPTGTTSIITNVIAGNRIGTHNDGNSILVDIDETITGLAFVANILTYTKEGGTTDVIDLSSYSQTYSSFTNTINGHRIGTHNSGNFNFTDIDETITSISFLNTTLTYVDEAGTLIPIDLSTINTHLPRIIVGNLNSSNHVILGRDDATFIDIDLSDLMSTVSNTINGNTIAIHTAGNGPITHIKETITGISLNGTDLLYEREDGAITTLDLAFANNPSVYNNNVSAALRHLVGIHNDGNGISTQVYETNTSLTISGSDLTYTDEKGIDNTITLPSGGTGGRTGTFVPGGSTVTLGNGYTFITVETIGSLTLVDPSPLAGDTVDVMMADDGAISWGGAATSSDFKRFSGGGTITTLASLADQSGGSMFRISYNGKDWVLLHFFIV